MGRKATIAIGVLTLMAIIATSIWVYRWYTAEVPGVVVYLEFETVGGLHPGAPVRVAGIVSGAVESISPVEKGVCRSGTDKPWAVRLAVRIDEEKLEALHQDASVFLTTVGPMGEVYVEVDPGSLSAPLIQAGDTLCGHNSMKPDDHAQRIQASLETLKENAGTVEEIGENFRSLKEHAQPYHEAWTGQRTVLMSSLEGIKSRVDTFLAHPLFDGVMLGSFGAVVDATLVVGRDIQKKTVTLSRSVKKIYGQAADTLGIWKRGGEGIATRLVQSQATLDDIREDGVVIASKMSDVRTSLGAMGSDKEIQNAVKGISKELKLRFWKFVFHGGDPIQFAQ